MNNRIAILLLSGYALSLVALQLSGYIWYINEPSVTSSVFYLAVTLCLSWGFLKEKRRGIFNKSKWKWLYKSLLSLNFGFAIVELYDTILASYKKATFVFDADKPRLAQLGALYDSFYKDALYEQIGHYLLTAGLLAVLFAVFLCFATEKFVYED